MVLCKVLWPGVGVKVDFFRYPIFGGFCPTYGPKRKFFLKNIICPYDMFSRFLFAGCVWIPLFLMENHVDVMK